MPVLPARCVCVWWLHASLWCVCGLRIRVCKFAPSRAGRLLVPQSLPTDAALIIACRPLLFKPSCRPAAQAGRGEAEDGPALLAAQVPALGCVPLAQFDFGFAPGHRKWMQAALACLLACTWAWPCSLRHRSEGSARRANRVSLSFPHPPVCSIFDIEQTGVPPPPKMDAYLKSRVAKFYAQLGVSCLPRLTWLMEEGCVPCVAGCQVLRAAGGECPARLHCASVGRACTRGGTCGCTLAADHAQEPIVPSCAVSWAPAMMVCRSREFCGYFGAALLQVRFLIN